MPGKEELLSGASMEAGRRLFSRQASFMLGVTHLDALPLPGPCEVAFAGRSNVGKSTLINALTGRNALARASGTPGRTREINYFNLDDVLYLVDLPGYGYARVSRKLSQAWMDLVYAFLHVRSVLRRVYVLVDIRHGPGLSDEEFMDLLDMAGVSYQIVLTKADKTGPGERDHAVARTRDIVSRRPAAHPVVCVTSARKGPGMAELRSTLAALASGT